MAHGHDGGDDESFIAQLCHQYLHATPVPSSKRAATISRSKLGYVTSDRDMQTNVVCQLQWNMLATAGRAVRLKVGTDAMLMVNRLQKSLTMKKLLAKAPSNPGSVASSPAAPGVKSCKSHMGKAQHAPRSPSGPYITLHTGINQKLAADENFCLCR